MADDMRSAGLREVPAWLAPRDLEALTAGRGALYALLARLFRTQVDAELLERLRAMEPPRVLDLPEIDEGFRLVTGYVRRATATVDILAVEFARIFLSGRRDAAAYPYESVYTSRDRLLMQGARDAVLAAFRREGLDRAPDWREPEDHVALELEFMARLCGEAAAAWGRGAREAALELLERQREFLNRHLLRWVPALCEDVRRLARTDFYRGLARLTVGFLRMDREIVARVAEAAANAVTGSGPASLSEGERRSGGRSPTSTTAAGPGPPLSALCPPLG